jgi:hypothetical protein
MATIRDKMGHLACAGETAPARSDFVVAKNPAVCSRVGDFRQAILNIGHRFRSKVNRMAYLS